MQLRKAVRYARRLANLFNTTSASLQEQTPDPLVNRSWTRLLVDVTH